MCALDLILLITWIVTCVLVIKRIQETGVVCANIKDILFKGSGDVGSETLAGWMGRSRLDCWAVRAGWWAGVVAW